MGSNPNCFPSDALMPAVTIRSPTLCSTYFLLHKKSATALRLTPIWQRPVAAADWNDAVGRNTLHAILNILKFLLGKTLHLFHNIHQRPLDCRFARSRKETVGPKNFQQTVFYRSRSRYKGRKSLVIVGNRRFVNCFPKEWQQQGVIHGIRLCLLHQKL